MANSDKNERISVTGITPIGIAVYPKLHEPDTKFDADGVYALKLKLTDDDAEGLIKQIDDLINDEFKKAVAEAKPQQKAKMKLADRSYEPEYDSDGKPTGFTLFNFKMKASGISKKTGKPWTRKPVIFDSKGKPITNPEIKVYGGSKVRVSYELTPFTTNIGSGVSQRLNAVQVVELSNGNSRNASYYGFGELDGYVADDATAISAYDSDETPTTEQLDTDF